MSALLDLLDRAEQMADTSRPLAGIATVEGMRGLQSDLRAAGAALRIGIEALDKVLGFDNPWSHSGHPQGSTGHECRACWIRDTARDALARMERAATP